MRDTRLFPRPRLNGGGDYRLGVSKDSHGGKTEVFADAMPPVSGTVVDSVGGGAATWNWRIVDDAIEVDDGCTDEFTELLVDALRQFHPGIEIRNDAAAAPRM